jgi:hypothetical protein
MAMRAPAFLRALSGPERPILLLGRRMAYFLRDIGLLAWVGCTETGGQGPYLESAFMNGYIGIALAMSMTALTLPSGCGSSGNSSLPAPTVAEPTAPTAAKPTVPTEYHTMSDGTKMENPGMKK